MIALSKAGQNDISHPKVSIPRKKSVAKFLAKLKSDSANSCDVDSESQEVPVRYRPESLGQLVNATKFTKKEIQLIYRGFKQFCPTGVVTSQKFKEIYGQFFPQGDPDHYAMFVFDTFDSDKNGHISFEEFVQGLSVLSRGTPEEKLRWIFCLYDRDKDGVLTRADVERVVSSVYDLMGKHTEPPIIEGTVKNHVDDVFTRMDGNGDGMIILSEFLDACLQDEAICQSIALFDTRFT